MRGGGPLVLALVLLAGCLAPASPTGTTSAVAGALGLALPVPVSKDYAGGEPVIAVASDGTLYVEGVGAGPNGNQNKVSESTDDGRTWRDVTPPALGQERSNDGFVAVGNGDSVYASNVFSTTLELFRSDDNGASYAPLAVPRVPALMHRHWVVPFGPSIVYVSVEALPPGFASYLGGVPPPQDVTGTPNEGMWFFKSADKGATWSVPQHIDPLVNFAGQSQMIVSPDGKSLYIARYEEASKFSPAYKSGKFYLLASHDGGDSWKRSEMLPLTSELSTAVPSLALDAAGTLYFTLSQQVGNVSRVEYTFSKDQGATWATLRELPQATGTHAMAWARAQPGAPNGTLDVMWYQADVANGTASKVNASWFVEYAQLVGADTDAPTITVQRVTPEPVHEGNICARGPACGPGEDRRLLDYPWMDFSKDGRAHLVFPSTKWQHAGSFAIVAVQQPR
jgi:hypothetical protein